MTFRKIRRILARLSGDKRSQNEKSASSTPRSSRAGTVRQPGSHAAPRPVPQHCSAADAAAGDSLPTSVDGTYHPVDVPKTPATSPTVLPPLLHINNEGNCGSSLERERIPSGKFLRPGYHEGEGIVRSTSGVTSTTSASSDYDRHSTTQSLCASPVPSAGRELMSDFHCGSTAPRLPLSGSNSPPRSTHSPIATETHLTSSIAPGPPLPAVRAQDVATDSSPAVVHETIHPVVKEEERRRVTTEHHHHHVKTHIVPILDRHTLPTKYYLQVDPENPDALKEITAEEARAYGEPVYKGEQIIAGDPVAEEVFKNFPVVDTIRTRIPTPHNQPDRTYTPRRPVSALPPPWQPSRQTIHSSEYGISLESAEREHHALGRAIHGAGGSSVRGRGSDSDSFTSSLSDNHREKVDDLEDVGNSTAPARSDTSVVSKRTFGRGGGGGALSESEVSGVGVLPDYL